MAEVIYQPRCGMFVTVRSPLRLNSKQPAELLAGIRGKVIEVNTHGDIFVEFPQPDGPHWIRSENFDKLTTERDASSKDDADTDEEICVESTSRDIAHGIWDESFNWSFLTSKAPEDGMRLEQLVEAQHRHMDEGFGGLQRQLLAGLQQHFQEQLQQQQLSLQAVIATELGAMEHRLAERFAECSRSSMRELGDVRHDLKALPAQLSDQEAAVASLVGELRQEQAWLTEQMREVLEDFRTEKFSGQEPMFTDPLDVLRHEQAGLVEHMRVLMETVRSEHRSPHSVFHAQTWSETGCVDECFAAQLSSQAAAVARLVDELRHEQAGLVEQMRQVLEGVRAEDRIPATTQSVLNAPQEATADLSDEHPSRQPSSQSTAVARLADELCHMREVLESLRVVHHAPRGEFYTNLDAGMGQPYEQATVLGLLHAMRAVAVAGTPNSKLLAFGSWQGVFFQSFPLSASLEAFLSEAPEIRFAAWLHAQPRLPRLLGSEEPPRVPSKSAGAELVLHS